jgi:hypothetical protein
MTRREFQSPDELAAWLAESGIDTAGWGLGSTKTLDDLWSEYVSGESGFATDPPSRLVEVAQLIIRRGDAILLEVEQSFSDGRRRNRLRPPSEKLLRGETPRAAALRCLSEELGLTTADVALTGQREPSLEMADSPSYPGLPTRYVFHTFEAAADSLPDGDFSRDNSDPDDPIRRHLWGWREA